MSIDSGSEQAIPPRGNAAADAAARAWSCVSTLGTTSADVGALSDEAVLAGLEAIVAAERALEPRKVLVAKTIVERSGFELGGRGLAARRGFLSPEALVQHVTGCSRSEAYKLLDLGRMLAETESTERRRQNAVVVPVAEAGDAEVGGVGGVGAGGAGAGGDSAGGAGGDGAGGAGGDGAGGAGGVGVGAGAGAGAGEPAEAPHWQEPIARALAEGSLSIDQADAIRKGLGEIDCAVTAGKLAPAVEGILDEALDVAAPLNADQLFQRARRMRDELDEAGIAAREKKAHDDRYLRVWRLADGNVRLSARFGPEDGEFVLSTYDSITSPRRGGVRFVDKERAAWAKKVQDDERSTEQIALDGFMTLLKLGVNADPRTVIGGRRPAVRMIVTQGDLGHGTDVPANGTGVAGSGPGAPGIGTGVSGTGTGVPGPEAGFGIIEGNPAPVSKEAIARNVCDSGLLPIAFDSNGNGRDLGQEQRLFSPAQRAALGVRDGGCLWPGCDRPPSWCEAHHIVGWTDDDGPTNLDNGCLLCSAHHLKLHNEHWRIVQVDGRRWLDAPPGIRSPSGRTPLTSKSRLMLTTFPARNAGSPVHAP